MKWPLLFPVYTIGKYRLAPIETERSKDIFALYSDPEICRYLQREPMQKESEAFMQIERWQRDFRGKRGLRWGIFEGNSFDASLMGTVALHYVNEEHQRAELGADLFPVHWGKGIITLLTGRLIEIAFSEIGLHRLELRCMPDNIPSVRIALKSGFTYEGTLRDYVFIPGKGFTSESVYSLLSSEYGVGE